MVDNDHLRQQLRDRQRGRDWLVGRQGWAPCMCGRKRPATKPSPHRVSTNERDPRGRGRRPEEFWLGLWDCARAVPLEIRQVCVVYFVLYFQRSGGEEIKVPYYDGYSGLG